MSMRAFSKELSAVAAQLVADPTVVRGGFLGRMTAVARGTNTGVVSIGTSTSQPVTLNAGDSIELYPELANEVYALSTEASADYVDGFIYS